MQPYRLATDDPDGPVIRVEDNAWIPNDPANRDWIAYQQWRAESEDNRPDPMQTTPPGPPVVELPQPTTLEADPVQDMDAATKRYVDEQIAEPVAQAFNIQRNLRR